MRKTSKYTVLKCYEGQGFVYLVVLAPSTMFLTGSHLMNVLMSENLLILDLLHSSSLTHGGHSSWLVSRANYS